MAADAVLERRSIRKYTDEAVDDASVERLLRAAMSAPSAGNQQSWQFVVVRDRETLARVPEFHPYSSMLPAAPVAILVCGVPKNCKWPQMWPQDCSAAAENMLIEAQIMGLGGVWLGVHPLAEREEGCRKLFGIPPEIVPFALLPFGHPSEIKPAAERFDPSRVHYERW